MDPKTSSGLHEPDYQAVKKSAGHASGLLDSVYTTAENQGLVTRG